MPNGRASAVPGPVPGTSRASRLKRTSEETPRQSVEGARSMLGFGGQSEPVRFWWPIAMNSHQNTIATTSTVDPKYVLAVSTPPKKGL